MTVCALCKRDEQLRESHVIPKFVFKFIKKGSPTGYLRQPLQNHNVRKQDGRKLELLCHDCEQRFSERERTFSLDTFYPFQNGKINQELTYDENLFYFISSINWRTL